MLLKRFLIIILFAIEIVTSSTLVSELSAKEKIRRHQEWLQLRNKSKTKYSNDSTNILDVKKINKYKTKFFDWPTSFHKTKDKYNEPKSKNEVYPEAEETTTNFDANILNPTSPSSFSKDSIDKYLNDISTKSWSLEHLNTDRESSHKIRTSSANDELSFQSTTELPEINHDSIEKLPPSVTEATVIPATTTELIITANNTGIKKPRVKKYPRWGSWSKWSVCSRSCGGGVMFQQRRCISKRANGKRHISHDCVGLFKRFQLCNEQECPANDTDFRQQQCSNYDDFNFENKTYTWEPYIKDDAECELNCKPVGMQYFATLNSSVIDGTKCSRPAEYYRRNYTDKAICVDGICKAIHASGVVLGTFANAGTIPCGGLVCRPISGVFIKNPLPNDYVHVATIPPGASNISITELKNSKNLLVLRSLNNKNYAFNGDMITSQGGSYDIAGSTFDYRRIDGLIDEAGKDIEGVTEWITCLGPIRESVELLILSKEANPGIKYEYLLPIISYSEEDDSENSVETDEDVNVKAGADDLSAEPVKPRRRRRFQWKVIGFSQCSKSCGGGLQTPIIRCVRETPKRFFSAKRCSRAPKPVLNENILRCNTQPCPAYWRVEEWGDCQCQQREGYRSREVRCVQELATGIVIQVNSHACLEEEPVFKRRCECAKTSRRKHSSNRNKLQAHTRPPVESISINSSTQGMHENSKAGVWLTSDWNQHCSAECGIGTEYRSIFCDRSFPNIERCDLRFTPDTTRPCENERSCETGEWFTSSWGQCTGSCFNLSRSRQVLCIRSQLIVEDDECRVDEKPVELQNCTFEDVEYCKPRWHYSTWTECSKSCDGGTQRRSVKCLELDVVENTLKESQRCRYSEREPIYRSCNTQKCYEPRVEMVQNDIAPNCIDEFSNCHLVVQANLCSYNYYQQNCCYSCSTENSEN